MTHWKDSQEFEKLTKRNQLADLDEIVVFAKANGVTEVRSFWELYDTILHAWKQYKSCEGDWT